MRSKKFTSRWKKFIYFWIGCILFTYIYNKINFAFTISFSAPITVFNYNLISLHNDVFWFILIILTLVYWSLYKILKDFSWNNFNKQKGILKIFNRYYMIFDFYTDIAVCWFFFLKLWLSYYFNLIEILICTYLDWNLKQNWILKNIKKIYLLLFGKEFFKGRLFPNLILNWNFEKIEQITTERFFFFKYYTQTNNAKFFYDSSKKLLHILQFRHSLFLEYAFAIFPTIIIGWILIPSFYLLYSLDDDSYPLFTIKVIGHQWYWSYEFDNFINNKYISYNFDSVLVQEADLKSGEKRLLTVDNNLIIPTAANIRFLITSSDVLHAWSIPEFGLKVDAIPGRLNEFITMICKPGFYYGQCSELCGVAHGFMPIVIETVNPNNWELYILEKNEN
jgi:cytochrome c oxidase subunit 2